MTAEIRNLETEVAERRLQMQQVASPQENDEIIEVQQGGSNNTNVVSSSSDKVQQQPKTKNTVRFS